MNLSPRRRPRPKRRRSSQPFAASGGGLFAAGRSAISTFPARPSAMNRTLVGLLTVGMLGLAGALELWGPEHDASLGNLQASAFRVGLVLAGLWLAHPELQRRTNRFLLLCIFAALVAIAIRPVLIVWILAALAIIAFLQPRLWGGKFPPLKR